MAPQILRYPKKNIGPQDDYFKIQVLKYQAPGLTSGNDNFGLRTTEEALNQGGSIKSSPLSIILPMPSNIQDNNSADWGSNSINPAAALAANGVSSLISGQKGLGDMATSGLKNLSAAINSKEGANVATSGFSALALKALFGQADLNSISSRFSGTVFNQNVELLFNNITMRPAYAFSFDIVPRSKSESDEVKQILWNLKRYMTPRRGPKEAGGGLFIQAPSVFKLDYMSGGKIHPFLHRFKPCALTQMSVNYTGSGNYATYSDATPVHMQLSLMFQELTPIYGEDYETGEFQEGRAGVGY